MRTRSQRTLLPALAACLVSVGVRAETGHVPSLGHVPAGGTEIDSPDGMEAALRRLDAEANALAEREEATRGALARRVRALYRLTRPGAAPLGAGFDAVRLHLSRVRHLERITAADARRLVEVGAERGRLRGERERLLSSLDVLRRRAAAHAQEEALAFPYAPEAASEERDAPFYGLRIVDGPPLEPFEDKRGALSTPMRGEVRMLDVGSAHGGNPALALEARAGTSVLAAAAGRVAFLGREPGQGLVCILDHGDGYSTLYGGLGRIEVERGDEISEGARIGTLGSEQSPPELYFEVRRRGRALPPREWLGF